MGEPKLNAWLLHPRRNGAFGWYSIGNQYYFHVERRRTIRSDFNLLGIKTPNPAGGQISLLVIHIPQFII